MKKDMLYTGVGFLALGIVFFVLYTVMEGKGITANFAGFAGGFSGPGIMMIYKYFHWSKPQNKAAYEKRLDQERINLKDERKVMIRARSGQIMYQVTLLLLAILTFTCSLMNVDKWVLLMLVFLFVFEIAGGWVVFKQLENKL